MKIEKFSQLAALVSGASVFTLGWFFVLGIVKVTLLTGLFFVFFCLLWMISFGLGKK